MEKLTDKQKKLIEDNYGYVKWWMNRVGASYDDYDVYLEVLCNAAMNWKEGGGATFCYYLDVSLRHRLYNKKYDNRENKTKHETSKPPKEILLFSLQGPPTPITGSEVVFSGNEITLEDVLPDKKDTLEEIETKINWDKFKNNQKPINRDILHYLELGKTQTEIAKKFGVSREAISRRVITMKRNYKRFAQVK